MIIRCWWWLMMIDTYIHTHICKTSIFKAFSLSKNHKFILGQFYGIVLEQYNLQYEGDILLRSWELRSLLLGKHRWEKRKKVFFRSRGPRPSSWGQSSSDSLLITWQQLLPAVVAVHVSSTNWSQWVIL